MGVFLECVFLGGFEEVLFFRGVLLSSLGLECVLVGVHMFLVMGLSW